MAGGRGESEHGVMGRGDSDDGVISAASQEGLGSPRWEVVPELLRGVRVLVPEGRICRRRRGSPWDR